MFTWNCKFHSNDAFEDILQTNQLTTSKQCSKGIQFLNKWCFQKKKKKLKHFLEKFLCNLNNLETSSSNLNTEAELNCTRWTPLIHICSIERGTFFSREFYVTQGCYNIKLIWEYTIKGAVYWWILKKKVINQKVYHNFRVKILFFF